MYASTRGEEYKTHSSLPELVMKEIGRNDPCACGSGKKSKHCCMRLKKDRVPEVRTGTPPSPGSFQTATEHHQAGRLPQAAAIYQQILQIAPKHPEALHLLGVISHQAGKNEVAVELIGKAIGVNPTGSMYCSLGNVLKDQGKLDEAVDSYHKALAVKPDYAEAHYNLGTALQAQGKLDEAVVSYRRALSFKPGFAEAHSNLGNALHAFGRLREAVESYHKALSFRPDLAEGHYNLGIALLAQGKPDEAVASFHKAISFRPDDAEAHNDLGNALRTQGKLDAAVASYGNALALKPDFAEAHNNLGNALKDQGKLDAAVASYRNALARKPDFAEAHGNLGNALREQGRVDEAMSAYEAVLRLDPSHGTARFALAVLRGSNPEQPPAEYVQSLFDGYADRFDSHLVDHLEYRVPAVLATEIVALRGDTARLDVVDLGCGTGLFGAAIRPIAGQLTGVDLSPRMLDKARKRNCYRQLIEGDIVDFLRGPPAGSFDLVAATDVFVYVGALEAVFAETVRTLRCGGLFAFSVEALPDATNTGYRLQGTGRYAHSADYLQALARRYGLVSRVFIATPIRKHGGTLVPGWIAIFETAP